MDERFLQLFEEELGHIREVGADFGRMYPRIAGRLAMGREGCDDPFVERMIEGFAFLAARTRLKLDAEYPKFCESLLETVYPLLLAPAPSMTVVELQPDPKLAGRFVVPRGTALTSHLASEQDTRCEFRTAHDVVLHPLRIDREEPPRYFTRDIERLRLPPQLGARAGLRLRLAHLQPDNPLSSLEGLDEITLHLAGNVAPAGTVFEEIMAHCTHVHLRPAQQGLTVPAGRTFEVGRDGFEIRPVGFEADESLLPGDPRTFDGHRLLREFSVLPERFLFIKIAGGELEAFFKTCGSPTADVIFIFDRPRDELARYIDVARFRLFATPAINLFERRADQIQLAEGGGEAHVVVDKTRPKAYEVFDVIEVRGVTADGGPRPLFDPFYRTASVGDACAGFFTMRREPRLPGMMEHRSGGGGGYLGSEVRLSVVDGAGALHRDGIVGLSVRVRCSNRHMAMQIPIGAHETDFFMDAGFPVERVRCLVVPTRPLEAAIGDAGVWKLLSHLSLNHLSLAGSERGIEALRELIGIYTRTAANDEANWTQGLTAVDSRPVVRRYLASGPVAFVRGLEVTLTIDEARLAGASGYLLGAVLARFFSRHVSINSFVETRLVSTRRGAIAGWGGVPGKLSLL
jgi:type VI secretion system protein ImpG